MRRMAKGTLTTKAQVKSKSSLPVYKLIFWKLLKRQAIWSTTWTDAGRVVQHLRDHDEKLRQGRNQSCSRALPYVYVKPNGRRCRSHTRTTKPSCSEQPELMQRVYEYEQACIACVKEIRDLKRRKVVLKESDWATGRQMLEFSRTGLVQYRVDPSELTPQPPPAGFLAGAESESSLSVVAQTLITAGMKKRNMFTALSSRSAEAVAIQQRQQMFMLECQEERRGNDEERHDREDAIRRVQAFVRDR